MFLVTIQQQNTMVYLFNNFHAGLDPQDELWTGDQSALEIRPMHKLRHIDTHLALYTMLYNNTAKK